VTTDKPREACFSWRARLYVDDGFRAGRMPIPADRSDSSLDSARLYVGPA